jgi:hypothetical protein
MNNLIIFTEKKLYLGNIFLISLFQTNDNKLRKYFKIILIFLLSLNLQNTQIINS